MPRSEAKPRAGHPKKAIREVVGIALVHQDLDERGTGATVEVFDDRIEVTNPGLPILPVDRFIDENQSRNEKFADALRQFGICEERGHGMDAVVTEIEGAQLPPHQCRLGSHHTTVILSRYKLLKNLTPDERGLPALLSALRQQADYEQRVHPRAIQNREAEWGDGFAAAGRSGRGEEDQAGGCERGQQIDKVWPFWA